MSLKKEEHSDRYSLQHQWHLFIIAGFGWFAYVLQCLGSDIEHPDMME